MISFSKFQFMILVASCVVFSLIGVSPVDAKEFTRSIPPFASLAAVTCPVSQNNCGSACNGRCSATSHKSACLMFCNLCCKKCLCVPPGTFGNKECCPCYNDARTEQGGPKCP